MRIHSLILVYENLSLKGLGKIQLRKFQSNGNTNTNYQSIPIPIPIYSVEVVQLEWIRFKEAEITEWFLFRLS